MSLFRPGYVEWYTQFKEWLAKRSFGYPGFLPLSEIESIEQYDEKQKGYIPYADSILKACKLGHSGQYGRAVPER